MVPLEDCDVRDKEKLAVYRYFRRQWLDMLNGDDEHAICKQITALLCADIEYRTIVFARKLSDEASNAQNGTIHFYIDFGFVAHQALAIRRLVEHYGGRKDRAVYSLPRIISELKEHCELLTRENYVCADGDPYDAPVNDPRHRAFDKLSHVASHSRSRGDLADAKCLDELQSRLESAKKVQTFVNKVLAHAADPRNRPTTVDLDHRDLEAAYRDLIWVANRLSGSILWGTHHQFLPTYACDMLRHLDNPICPQPKMEELSHFWTTRYKELEDLERSSNNGRQ